MIPAATGAIVLLMALLDQGRALATGHHRRARRGRRRARALDIHTGGSMGALPDSLPGFLLAEVPLNLQTLANIFPCADRLAVVGLLESMMTASVVVELTDTPRNENRECVGQVFFASCEALIAAFDFKALVDKVQIDVGGAHFRDITAPSALDNVVPELEREGTEVEVTGPNEAGATMVDRHAVHDKPGAVERLMH
jgi:MFS superfamily sulfate permease-like transporter